MNRSRLLSIHRKFLMILLLASAFQPLYGQSLLGLISKEKEFIVPLSDNVQIGYYGEVKPKTKNVPEGRGCYTLYPHYFLRGNFQEHHISDAELEFPDFKISGDAEYSFCNGGLAPEFEDASINITFRDGEMRRKEKLDGSFEKVVLTVFWSKSGNGKPLVFSLDDIVLSRVETETLGESMTKLWMELLESKEVVERKLTLSSRKDYSGFDVSKEQYIMGNGGRMTCYPDVVEGSDGEKGKPTIVYRGSKTGVFLREDSISNLINERFRNGGPYIYHNDFVLMDDNYLIASFASNLFYRGGGAIYNYLAQDEEILYYFYVLNGDWDKLPEDLANQKDNVKLIGWRPAMTDLFVKYTFATGDVFVGTIALKVIINFPNEKAEYELPNSGFELNPTSLISESWNYKFGVDYKTSSACYISAWPRINWEWEDFKTFAVDGILYGADGTRTLIDARTLENSPLARWRPIGKGLKEEYDKNIEAQRAARQKRQQQEENKFFSKYGSAGKALLNDRITVGAPFSMLEDAIKVGFILSYSLSIDYGSRKCYDFSMDYGVSSGFFWVDNGTITSVSYD